MHIFLCPHCEGIVFLETLTCPSCGGGIGFHLPSGRMLTADADGTRFDGDVWRGCTNRFWGCNWLVSDGEDSAMCFSCRLTRRRPDSDDTVALEKLGPVGADKRRVLLQATRLGLPIVGWYEQEGGLGFDLLSSRSGHGPVRIGHARGIITIDLAESLDDHRERLRVQLGEPYRTMLGHFRHEIGHYYQWILVERTEWIGECRELFGDERASYAEAIARHYRTGAPENWRESYISEYATMHPWEDFAETWAHYLHITDCLGTLGAAGVDLLHDRYPGILARDIVPRVSYVGVSTSELLEDWFWCSKLLNRANRAMGRGDLYPFDIVPKAAEKLDFVHRVVQASSQRRPA